MMLKSVINKILTFLGLRARRPTSLDEWEGIVAKSVEISSAMLLPYITDAKVFVDVGANVGAFTQLVVGIKPDITVHLFEPVPLYYLRCKQKFAANDKVVVNNLALSDHAGKDKLFLDSKNLGWNTMIKEKTSSDMKEELVEVVPFDEYATRCNIERIDIIKIDVEGAEFKVINGMRNTLARLQKKPVILCEIGWGRDSHPNWDKEVDVFEWLFSIGYKRFDYNSTGTRDVLFVPQ